MKAMKSKFSSKSFKQVLRSLGNDKIWQKFRKLLANTTVILSEQVLLQKHY